jgi:uncharacterized membrane protein YdbT with pleckstrin-like domain
MIDIKLNKKEKKVVEKEVRHRLYVRAKKHASDFRKEFKKQLLFAVSAAFGFLMAFSWREPIMDFIGFLINSVGIKSQIYDGVISAVVLTVVGVLFLMVISKWASEEK